MKNILIEARAQEVPVQCVKRRFWDNWGSAFK